MPGLNHYTVDRVKKQLVQPIHFQKLRLIFFLWKLRSMSVNVSCFIS